MKRENTIGALVIGGDHPGLAIARSLAPRGIPVWVLDDQFCISSFSRYVSKVLRRPNLRDHEAVVDAVIEIGQQHGLQGWVLFPTRDETVAAFSRHRDRLAEHFRVTTPAWETVRWAWDKKNTYRLAEQLRIPVPRTWQVEGSLDVERLSPHLPLAVKPAVKENFFYATGAKAWRADTPEQLRALVDKAARDIHADEILVQEIIPGDGRQQLSYCAFFKDGNAHSTLLARRMRQHPREFGRAATYVETIELPAIEELALRFLRAIDYYGLVEVEFKQDPRDGEYKLLDVNARAWGFHGLGQAVGVDFPYLLYADQCGLQTSSAHAAPGQGWLRLIPDLAVVAKDLADGYLSFGAYWQSLKATKVESVFAHNDPLPFVGELALLPYLIVKKYGMRRP
jgi:D-aspartate ligase